MCRIYVRKLTPQKNKTKQETQKKKAKTIKVKFYPPCFVTYISPRHILHKAIIFIMIAGKRYLETC